MDTQDMEIDSFRFRQATIGDAPDLARILTATNAATFRGLVPDECLTSPTLEESESNWRRALSAGELIGEKFMIVAERTGVEGAQKRLVGYVIAGGKSEVAGYERELNVLMVDTAWQRQGIGRKLMSLAAAELQRQGARSMLVGIQIDNPNRAFYKRLGGRLVSRRPLNWAGYETEELLYGYDDISTLVDDG
jgi:ribosomal protein S18 acetylase RimI-like enzyme